MKLLISVASILLVSIVLLLTTSAAAAANTTVPEAPECCKKYEPAVCTRATIDVKALAEGKLKEVTIPFGIVIPFHGMSADNDSFIFTDPAAAELTYLPETKEVRGYFSTGENSQILNALVPGYNLEACKGGEYVWRNPLPESAVRTTPEATTPEATAPEATTPEATAPEATAPGSSSASTAECCRKGGSGHCFKADIDIQSLGKDELKELKIAGGKVLQIGPKTEENKYTFNNPAQVALTYDQDTKTVNGYGGSNVPGENLVFLEHCDGQEYVWREVPNFLAK